jgi:hypothetical protein
MPDRPQSSALSLPSGMLLSAAPFRGFHQGPQSYVRRPETGYLKTETIDRRPEDENEYRPGADICNQRLS